MSLARVSYPTDKVPCMTTDQLLIKGTEAEHGELLDVLGQSFHTAFRKAGDSIASSDAHAAIKGMDEDEWESILDFVVYCLNECGYIVIKEAEAAS